MKIFKRVYPQREVSSLPWLFWVELHRSGFFLNPLVSTVDIFSFGEIIVFSFSSLTPLPAQSLDTNYLETTHVQLFLLCSAACPGYFILWAAGQDAGQK